MNVKANQLIAELPAVEYVNCFPSCGDETNAFGATQMLGQPITLSRTPSKLVRRPPERGEHTAEVLAEFGFSTDEIEGLVGRNVI